MEHLPEKYNLELEEGIERKVKVIANNCHQLITDDTLKQVFKFLDLTSLNTNDTESDISDLLKKLNELKHHYPEVPSVAAVCFYPPFVELAKSKIEDNNVYVASVGANFPTSQTFLSVKKTECKEIIHRGADEVDIVIPVYEFLAGNYDAVYNEVKEIKEVIGNKKLKVILETGMLNDYKNIQLASLISMEAGADFIKTSTGKEKPAATYDAVYIMAKSARAFYEKTGKMTGIKPAGGISTVEDAFGYYAIIKEILGEQWLNSSLFRIGASRLANELICAIYKDETISYF
ncbi:MAG: deoxyribose-phosphate aldolase [Bacteroidota bacterium]